MYYNKLLLMLKNETVFKYLKYFRIEWHQIQLNNLFKKKSSFV